MLETTALHPISVRRGGLGVRDSAENSSSWPENIACAVAKRAWAVSCGFESGGGRKRVPLCLLGQRSAGVRRGPSRRPSKTVRRMHTSMDA